MSRVARRMTSAPTKRCCTSGSAPGWAPSHGRKPRPRGRLPRASDSWQPQRGEHQLYSPLLWQRVGAPRVKASTGEHLEQRLRQPEPQISLPALSLANRSIGHGRNRTCSCSRPLRASAPCRAGSSSHTRERTAPAPAASGSDRCHSSGSRQTHSFARRLEHFHGGPPVALLAPPVPLAPPLPYLAVQFHLPAVHRQVWRGSTHASTSTAGSQVCPERIPGTQVLPPLPVPPVGPGDPPVGGTGPPVPPVTVPPVATPPVATPPVTAPPVKLASPPVVGPIAPIPPVEIAPVLKSPPVAGIPPVSSRGLGSPSGPHASPTREKPAAKTVQLRARAHPPVAMMFVMPATAVSDLRFGEYLPKNCGICCLTDHFQWSFQRLLTRTGAANRGGSLCESVARI